MQICMWTYYVCLLMVILKISNQTNRCVIYYLSGRYNNLSNRFIFTTIFLIKKHLKIYVLISQVNRINRFFLLAK